MLEDYDPCLRSILVNGFTFGFDLGYRGTPASNISVKNLVSTLEFPDVIHKSLMKEVDAGRMLGPLDTLPFEEFQISPIGLVPKKAPGEFRMITNLSSPKGKSVNDGILEEFVHVSYSSLEDAIRLICQCGSSPFLAKLDIKHAYQTLNIHFCVLNGTTSSLWIVVFQWGLEVRRTYLSYSVLPFISSPIKLAYGTWFITSMIFFS